MTNFEKYKEKIEKLKNKYSFTLDLEGNVVDCNDILCRNCKFQDFATCKNSKINWLFDEYKESVLTNDELEFIKALEKIKKTKYKFIAKSLDGSTTFFTRKPFITPQSAGIGNYYYYTGRKNYAVFFEDVKDLFPNLKSKDGLYDIENKCFIKK